MNWWVQNLLGIDNVFIDFHSMAFQLKYFCLDVCGTPKPERGVPWGLISICCFPFGFNFVCVYTTCKFLFGFNFTNVEAMVDAG